VDALGGFWHLANLFAPAIGVGLIATLIAKLLWWRDLRSASWLRLWAWAALPAALVTIAGLVVFGRDGKLATYFGIVLACALGLWRAGFVRR
jgi:hypothetical protein